MMLAIKNQQNVLNSAIYRANLGEYKLMQRRISNAQNMAFMRANQTDDQRILRNAQMARKVALRCVQESFNETDVGEKQMQDIWPQLGAS
jgi:hypothetical protein